VAENSDVAVQVVDLSKNYGDVTAVKSVNLTINSGEYFVLLGPSGGGKTTLLRLIGGFIRATSGQVLLHGRDMSRVPPEKRPTSMVFQSYALFPHMTVANNVGYGLRLRKMPKSEIDEHVERMLALVGLIGYGERKPWELSGGQQQRVQLARALVLETNIILLDEPLAALDDNLRKDMCYELKHLQEKVGITFVHVTHNQGEAMTVADRIAIIADGELVEHGSAREIYRRPECRFTAEFIGENNVFDGKVIAATDSDVVLDVGFGEVAVGTQGRSPAAGSSASLSVRSESMRLTVDPNTDSDAFQVFPATYQEKIYLGLLLLCSSSSARSR
jgi:ABC-type Fe3+/spermidine/putrescine transport system ATPase subunit